MGIVRMFLIGGFVGGFGAPHWLMTLVISGGCGLLLFLVIREEEGWFPLVNDTKRYPWQRWFRKRR